MHLYFYTSIILITDYTLILMIYTCHVKITTICASSFPVITELTIFNQPIVHIKQVNTYNTIKLLGGQCKINCTLWKNFRGNVFYFRNLRNTFFRGYYFSIFGFFVLFFLVSIYSVSAV